SARAERFRGGPITPGTHDFGPPSPVDTNQLAYAGRWRIDPESATADGGQLNVAFDAKRGYLVMGGNGARRNVRVLRDGRPLEPSVAGTDVHGEGVSVSADRLYALVNLPNVQRHTLTLTPERGARLFDFTFG